MNPLQALATLRKFGYFLVGLFPLLGWLLTRLNRGLRSVRLKLLKVRHNRKLYKHISRSRMIQGGYKIVERFYFRDYSKDQLDLQALPPESRIILRPVFLVTAALCILTPFTLLEAPSTLVTNVRSQAIQVSTWSVLLWLISLATGWGALLAGTAFANGGALFVGVLSYLFMFGTIAGAGAKDISNIFIPIAAYTAIFAYAIQSDKNKILQGLFCALAGAPAGIWVLAALQFKMPEQYTYFGPYSSLMASLPCGAAIGVCLYFLAKKIRTIPPALSSSAWIFKNTTILIGLNIACLIARCDLSKTATQAFNCIHYTAGFLWPIWYLLSVGIIFKLLKSSKIVASGLSDMAGERLLRPLVFALFIFGTILLYSEPAVDWFGPKSPFNKISIGAAYIYSWSKNWFWANTINAFSAPVMRPVVALALGLLTLLAIRKKLTNAMASRVLYLISLSWFLVSEYMFQFLSLGRSTTHSVIVLLFFSIWLLWLMHTVGLSMSTRSSRLWPDLGRLPIYGGLLVFVLLEIHSRAAMQDFKIMDEIFMSMQRGLIDVGLPYFLYVYAGRRLKELPVALGTIFGAFCAGALISMPLNALNKMSVCGWDWQRFVSLISNQGKILAQSGDCSMDMHLPVDWVIIRTLAYSLIIFCIGWFARRYFIKKEHDACELAVAFVLLAFGSGIASFSKSNLDIGLTGSLAAATFPFKNELFFTVHVLITYLVAWLPPVFVAMGFQREKRLFYYAYPAIACFLAIGIELAYQTQEDFLRASGAMISITGLAALLFVACIARLLHNDDKTSISREIGMIGCGLAVTLVAIGSTRIAQVLTNVQEVPTLDTRLLLPGSYKYIKTPPISPTGEVASLYQSSGQGLNKSYLAIGNLATRGKTGLPLMAQIIGKAQSSGAYSDLKVVQLAPWDKRSPGTIACTFTYQLDAGINGKPLMIPMVGMTAVMPPDPSRPDKAERADFVTMFCGPGEIEERKWQVAYLIDQIAAKSKR